MKNIGQMVPRFAMLGAFLTVLTASAVKGAEPVCSQATLQGTYVTSAAGTVPGGTTGALAFVTVGKVTYDGRGGGASSGTQSVAGTISRGKSTATYTVNPDCTGSKNFEGTTFDFVVTADGREIFFIVTNAGTVISGRAVRLDNNRN